MDRRIQRTEAEWQSLISELQALKRKLHSKSEALLIISKDLAGTQKERDQFKLMAEKLRVRCQAYKRQFSDYPLTHDQMSMLQTLKDARNQKIAHQKQSEVIQQKLNEALGDVKLLRERFARQRIGDEGIGPRHFPAHEREELVVQLETAKQQAELFRQELNISRDQVTELTTEKDDFLLKSERLNNELNFMLNGDKKRIIDIDALCMENKYLQERVKQCQEEKNSLHAQLSKLKGLLNARKTSNTDIVPGKIRNSGLIISPKQVKEILTKRASLPTSAETVSDLQSIAAALLETINDKNLALHHLRNTNKILGNRVAEVEKKLRTFEVGGLWNINGQSPTSPKIIVEKPTDRDNLTPTPTEINEEFFSSLGSRLSKLTDVCSKSFDEYKLDSLTPESSGSASDVTKDYDAIGDNDDTKCVKSATKFTEHDDIANGATTNGDTVVLTDVNDARSNGVTDAIDKTATESTENDINATENACATATGYLTDDNDFIKRDTNGVIDATSNDENQHSVLTDVNDAASIGFIEATDEGTTVSMKSDNSSKENCAIDDATTNGEVQHVIDATSKGFTDGSTTVSSDTSAIVNDVTANNATDSVESTIATTDDDIDTTVENISCTFEEDKSAITTVYDETEQSGVLESSV